MEETNIRVVDALMGKGKTSWAIQHINESTDEKRFIFITPYLEEVERIKQGVTSRRMVSPESKQGKWTKKQDLKKLLFKEKDIVATHALFKKIDDETIDLIRMGNYTLILDEVVEVLKELEVSEHDYATLFKDYMTYDEESKICSWTVKGYTGEYERYKYMAETGNLLHYGKKLLFWTFPLQAFYAFDYVYILTYMFDGQVQRYYYDMNNVSYTKVGVQRHGNSYRLTEYTGISDEDRLRLKKLINIHDSKWNDIGKAKGREQPLSADHLKRISNQGGTALNKIGNTALRYYRETIKSLNVGPEAVMWTCKKDYELALGRNGYRKQFVSLTARASNQWQDKSICIYLSNRFMIRPFYNIFSTHGIKVDDDLFALSELLQWLFRSQIRNGKPIELFIPSDRMRSLLKEYLGY